MLQHGQTLKKLYLEKKKVTEEHIPYKSGYGTAQNVYIYRDRSRLVIV